MGREQYTADLSLIDGFRKYIGVSPSEKRGRLELRALIGLSDIKTLGFKGTKEIRREN